jgi:hypothetical protein
MAKVFAFLKDESGATAIEYGLIAARRRGPISQLNLRHRH